MSDKLKYVPDSHTRINHKDVKTVIDVITDELALLCDIMIQNGGNASVITQAFIEVVGTIRHRFILPEEK